ncbi:MAG: hypothetical protein LBB08_01275 [Rickettsiales bacterium]|jgi:hypothetical protein|nr:hypothetical protein [Rickettsiales bacterium]
MEKQVSCATIIEDFAKHIGARFKTGVDKNGVKYIELFKQGSRLRITKRQFDHEARRRGWPACLVF